MTVSAMDFLSTVAQTLRVALPNVKKVHLERIKKQELPLLSIELIAYEVPAVDFRHVNKRIDLDIIYLSEDNTISSGLAIVERLMEVFTPGLHVADRYIYTSEAPEIKFVDQDLHFMIEFQWRDSYKPLLVTDYNNLVEFEQGSSHDKLVIKEIELEPKKDDDGNPIVDEDGNPVTDDDGHIIPELDEDGVAKERIEYMKQLFITFED